MKRSWLSAILCLSVVAVLLAPLVPFVPAVQAAPPTSPTSAPASARPRPADPGPAPVQTSFGQMPIYFVANQGQADGRVAYYVEGGDKTLYFTPEGVTFALTALPSATPAAGAPAAGDAPPLPKQYRRSETAAERWAVKLDFVDANAVQPVGQEATEAVISYFKGPRDKWRTGLPTYSRIVYHELWPGIDLAYSGTVGRLKYEFVVQPGADPARIRLAYRGATVRVDGDGQLEVSTPAGAFRDAAPVAYQETGGQRLPVGAAYLLEEPADVDGRQVYGFHLGAYDPAVPLVIDPAVLIYAGYIGGAAFDYGTSIAVDPAGAAYITGCTESAASSFPVKVGPDLTYGDRQDAFIVKINAAGTGLVYAGYIGGSWNDCAGSIAVDAAGNAYIAGVTSSPEDSFPVTVGPDLTWNGGHLQGADAFVAKVKADGKGLVYAGYIGGNHDDSGQGIAVDEQGNAYVVGQTEAITHAPTDFPVAVGPDLTPNGLDDAFVAKVKANGSGLDYCGYIGGSSIDQGYAIAVDYEGSAYVTGTTQSGDFPAKVGPYLTIKSGAHDAFVAKVKPNGSDLVYAGYLGSGGDDHGYGIAVSAGGYAYVTGVTDSSWTNFPVAEGPDLTGNGGWDAFVAEVDSDGTELLYSGYIGGANADYGLGIATSMGMAYVTGLTCSPPTSFPVQVGPDLTGNGGCDAFVAEVGLLARLVYCGYIGGSQDDGGTAIAVDSDDNAYITGYTFSPEGTFPDGDGFGALPGFDRTHNGDRDAFVVKVGAGASGALYAASPYAMPYTWVLYYATITDTNGDPVRSSDQVSMTLVSDSYEWLLQDDGVQDDMEAGDGVHSGMILVEGEGPLESTLYYQGQEMATTKITVNQHPHLVVLTDLQALYRQFLDTGLTPGQDADGDGEIDFYQMLGRLHQYAANHKGMVYDVLENIAGAPFDVSYRGTTFEGSDPATNRFRRAKLIDQALTELHRESMHTIADVVLVGTDEVIPFYRIRDTSATTITPSPGEDTQTMLDMVAGYVVTDMPYGTVDYVNQEAVEEPYPQIPVGRVAADTPLAMIGMFDAYEKPVVLDPREASAALFALADSAMHSSITEQGLWTPILTRHYPLLDYRTAPPFRPGYYRYNGTLVNWGPADVLGALGATNLTVLLTNGGYHCDWTMQPADLCGVHYAPLAPAGGKLYIIPSNYSGLLPSVFSPSGNPGWYNGAIARWVQKAHRTLAGITWQGWYYDDAVGLTDYLMVNWAAHALHESNRTVGDAFVHAWDGYWDSIGAWLPLGRSVGYGPILWGLPTQVIQHGPPSIAAAAEVETIHAGAGSVVQEAGAVERSFTVEVKVAGFQIDEDAAGALLVRPANGGGIYAEGPGEPMLPQVIQSFRLPPSATEVQVTEDEAARITEAYGTVQLQTAELGTTGTADGRATGGAAAAVPARAAPSQPFTFSVQARPDAAVLTLAAVPAQYTAQGQLTLFTKMKFTVRYRLPAAPAAAITGLTVNNGNPVPAGTAAVPLKVRVSSDVARPVTVIYSVADSSGLPLGGGEATANLPAGAGQVNLTLDAGRWTAGPKVLSVRLGGEEGTLDAASTSVQVLGLRMAAEVGRPRVMEGAGVPLAVRLWLEDGAPATGLAAGIAVQVDGTVRPVALTEGPAGEYGGMLSTAGLVVGAHQVKVTATDSRGLKAEAWTEFVTVRSAVYLPFVARKR